MARISTYNLDTTIEKSDKLLGSNIGGQTKNFNIQDIAEWLASTNASGNASAIPLTYDNQSASSGKMTFQGNTDNELAFPTGNNKVLQVSKYPNGYNDRNIVPVLNTYLDKEIIISKIQDPTVFAVYKVKNIAQVDSTDVYNVTMDYLSGNNNSSGKALFKDSHYNLVLFTGAQDKDFNLDFTTNSLQSNSNGFELTVAHNLGKFPNITVKVSTGHIVEVPVQHIDKNNSKVFFKGLNSGTVHAN